MGQYRREFWESTVGGLGMPRQHRRSGVYRTYMPTPLAAQPLSVSTDTAAALGEAERLIAALEASLATSQEFGLAPKAMLRFLEGISSSAMEGYRSAAARLVATMTANGAGAKGSDLKIVGNLATLDRAHTLADADTVTIHDVVAMQAELMNEHGESSLIGVRSEQNWVGGSDYHPLDASHVPPPPEEVNALMQDLCAFVSQRSSHSPLLRAAVAHAQFETIHPFLDGNGRAGRALVHLMLRRDGLTDTTVLPMSGTWGKDKVRYIDFLNGLRIEGAWNTDVVDEAARYMADTATDAATGAFAIAGAVQQTQQRTSEQAREHFRADSVAHRIVHDACVSLGVTTDGIATRHGVDRAAALRTLDRMEELGMVKRRSAQRPHVFYVPAIIELVERFASQIPDSVDGETTPDTEALVSVAAAERAPADRGRERCGAWMPRSRARCALPKGHPGWPEAGHRQA